MDVPAKVYRLPDGRGGFQETDWNGLNRFRWETGIGLEELLDPLQLELDILFDALPKFGRNFILCSRKIGKTYGVLSRANKLARRKRNAIIRFGFPTKEQGKTIVIPLLEEIQETCPEDLKWRNREAQEGCWYLPHTNSRLYLAGSDTQEQLDRLRGPRSDFTVLDEVTFFHCDLRRLMRVLQPQLLSTGGNIVMTGTPPETLDHPSVEYIDHARKHGRLIIKTIFDNPRLSRDDIRMICSEANMHATHEEVDDILAGKMRGAPEWHREYLCEMVTDEGARVIPEYVPGIHARAGGIERPLYSDKYVFIDPGHARDFFALVFAYLDFANQRLVAVRSICERRKTTDEILEMARKVEVELGWSKWTDASKTAVIPSTRGEEKLERWCDASATQLIADFSSKGYRVKASPKSPGKGKLVTELQNRMRAGQVLIDLTGCPDLAAQLEHGIWSDAAKADFKRTEHLGHLDALDAAATGIRQVAWRHNPAPPGVYLGSTDNAAGTAPELERGHSAKTLNRVFAVNGRTLLRG